MTADKIALVCPLDWGIGHATRCVPVILALRDQGWKVVVAADGRPYEFYRNEYPQFELLRFPGPRVTYPSAGAMMVPAMAAMIPKLLLGIRREQRQLQKLVKDTHACLVISDNRYGCRNKRIYSVFITHQLNIRVPAAMGWAAPLLRKISSFFITQYDECWIPDTEDEGGLSGRLSHCHKLPGNAHFIGPLTRFGHEDSMPANMAVPEAEIFVMLSGPEPQRSTLEKLLISQIGETSYTAVIAGGRTEAGDSGVTDGRIHIFPHMSSPLMKHYIRNSKYIICRSGYSTLMDLAVFGRPAILVPTPGQTEQEYLANRLSRMNVHYSVPQSKFRLKEALEEIEGHTGIVMRNDLTVLSQRIKRIGTQTGVLRAQ